jgi:predicted PhzF superfamily epimerase YddE/YHI9
MRLPIFQVDAFASRVFAGNPAAVCPLEAWLPAATMQSIAEENNLSETVFFVPDNDKGAYRIRWFTPTTEIDLAGHPTLAAAFVIFEHLDRSVDIVRFRTRHDDALVVAREGELLTLDFPARPATARPDLLPALAEGLGEQPEEALAARDGVAVFANAAQVSRLRPDLARLAALDVMGVIATAPGSDCDFVSRFFAPKVGVPEDPVTGSAHCTLVPYWAARLARKTLFARQISARGGELWCEDRGARVGISGRAVLYLEGTIVIP